MLTRNTMLLLILGHLLLGSDVRAAETAPQLQGADKVARYNVVWESPSKDACGSMPIGNGEFSANCYVVEDGDLYLLMSSADAFTGNGDLNKTGWVRVHLDPNPFTKDKAFRQTLDLPTGSIAIEADGVKIRVWVDANRPVYRVDIDSPRELTVTAVPEFWNRRDRIDDQRIDRSDKIIWYHNNGDKTRFLEDLKHYDVEHMAATYPDPFAYNTYGGLLDGQGMHVVDGKLTGNGKKVNLRIHSLIRQMKDSSEWVEEIENVAKRPASGEDWKSHCQWWASFWNRSWIVVSDNTVPAAEREKALPALDLPAWKDVVPLRPKTDGTRVPLNLRKEADGGFVVAQNYQLQRFMMACQGRAKFQVNFAGGNFTMPMPGATGQAIRHVDSRMWAAGYTYQNQRLLYWPLLAAGDADLMFPTFHHYVSMLPLRKAITKTWFGHDGVYYRENTLRSGREVDGSHVFDYVPGEKTPLWFHDYYLTSDGKIDASKVQKPVKWIGKPEDCPKYCHPYYFTCGLEMTFMKLEYYRYTKDATFRDEILIPFAREILTFHDKHWSRDANGKLCMDPSQSLETWWYAKNPTPDIAGLQTVIDGLLELPHIADSDRKNWTRMRGYLPPIPTREVDGMKVIAPAEVFARKGNLENPELYAAFPFPHYGIGRDDLDVYRNTLKKRVHRHAFNDRCWSQDEIHLAIAGLAAEAKDGLETRFRQYSPFCRFIAFAPEFPDACPDLDHMGSGSLALQKMLLQEVDGKLYLLPAWPWNWDVNFKLHVPGAVVSGKVKDGVLKEWNIVPESRRKDVVVMKPQLTGLAKVAEDLGFDPDKLISIAGKPSRQANDHDAKHLASLANDGSTSGGWNKCASTQKSVNPWWEVDLGDTYQIGTVVLFNRTDAAMGRLSNFHILISEEPFISDTLDEVLKQPGVKDMHFKEGGTAVIKVPAKGRGRYVRLQLASSNFLHFSEMLIFADCGN